MTTEETLAFLCRDYVEQSGIIARVRDDGTRERAATDDPVVAIDALRVAWSDSTCLPLEHVWLLSYTDEAQAPYCDWYPEHGCEIFDAQRTTVKQIEGAILSVGDPKASEKIEAELDDFDHWENWRAEGAAPDRPLTVDEALLALRYHISRGYGLIVALRTQWAAFAEQAMKITSHRLRKSLDTKCPVWRDNGCAQRDSASRSRIEIAHRDSAYGLASLRSWLLHAQGFYTRFPVVHERLLARTDELTARVRRCLAPSGHTL
jgi:hypothetical protein